MNELKYSQHTVDSPVDLRIMSSSTLSLDVVKPSRRSFRFVVSLYLHSPAPLQPKSENMSPRNVIRRDSCSMWTTEMILGPPNTSFHLLKKERVHTVLTNWNRGGVMVTTDHLL